jgi:L-seryl-tRNA(Ser) seleniumtransferase
MESHPLARAFRTDKLTLASTISTIKSYIKGTYEDEIPIWKIVSQSIRTLERRANTICKKSEIGAVIDGSSVLGGGSMPDQTIPTKLIRIDCDEKTQNIQKQLVNSRPCIMPRISDGKVYIDVRTVLETQDDLLINLLIDLLGGK